MHRLIASWLYQAHREPLYASTRGDGKAGEFDQIYQTSDGSIIIIEAKGGNGSLGSRRIGVKNFQQGHPKYHKDVIRNYKTKLS
ncbi:MAG: hypothetical protein CSA50_01675 [Gammaproteobacteria bacterium]|nr:MAG: hypothetical protein CSA50_01675 [Gammaproteobacteria bacterium]